jgi:adenosylhomocysteinase
MISVDWFCNRMKLVKKFVKEVEVEEVAVCIPLEPKTACMLYELSKFTRVFATKLDDFSTKIEAIEWLRERGIDVVNKREAIKAKYFIDCSAVLSRVAEKAGKDEINVVELTKTGENYLKKIKCRIKAISVDSSKIKEFESVYATCFGLLEALLRLNVYLPSKSVRIVGFGKIGQGCANLLRKIGCRVVVWDKDEEKRLRASFFGFEVSRDARADILVLCTDSKVGLEYVNDGCIVVNMGAEKFEAEGKLVEDFGIVKSYEKDGILYYLVSDGYAANLAIANGTPIEAMDMTFSAAILALNHLKKDFSGIISLPKEIEEKVVSEALSGNF